jgi:hypothetical protein
MVEIDMIGITTRTSPYRLDSKGKEPIDLYIKLTNSPIKRLLSIDLLLDEDISFNKIKPINTDYKRLGEFGPGEVKEIRYTIYPAVGAYPGLKTVKIRVGEHATDYNIIDNKTESTMKINMI